MRRSNSLAISRYATIALLLIIAAVASVAHRRALQSLYVHPDEEIARAVVTNVLATKKKDTNWAHTDIAAIFHYNQFNFSAYYLAAVKIEKFAHHRTQDLGDSRLLLNHLREQNMWLGGLVIFLAGLLGLRIAAPAATAPIAGIAAALFTACCVTLFQDSIYARPEAFVTVLTLLFVFVLLAERLRPLAILALAGLLLGVLIATKVTFLMFLPFPLLVISARAHALAVSPAPPHPWRVAAAVIGYLACIVAGFGIGAPYALQAPWEYLEGVGHLLHQYSTGYGAHGLHDGGISARFGNGIAYLIYTDGVVVLLFALGALFNLFRGGKHVIVLALAGPLLTLIYFLQTRAFFERNFSHALPILFALAGLGLAQLIQTIGARFDAASIKTRLLQAATACLAIALAVYTPWSVSALLDRVLHDDHPEQRSDEAARTLGNDDAIPLLAANSDFSSLPNLAHGLCGKVIFKVVDYGDPYAQQRLTGLRANGYSVLAYLRGPFDGAPVSTLQAYHAANVVFLGSPPDPADKTCKAELIGLPLDTSAVDVDAKITLSPAWTPAGYPTNMSVHGWSHPLYASWSGSDGNKGDITIGPFKSCSDVVVPYAIGPAPGDIELLIEREVGQTRETIVQGAPPPVAAWSAIRIHRAASCATYTIHAADHGAGWGQWLGIGLPVELRPRDSQALAPGEDTGQTPKSAAASQARCSGKNCGSVK